MDRLQAVLTNHNHLCSVLLQESFNHTEVFTSEMTGHVIFCNKATFTTLTAGIANYGSGVVNTSNGAPLVYTVEPLYCGHLHVVKCPV